MDGLHWHIPAMERKLSFLFLQFKIEGRRKKENELPDEDVYRCPKSWI